MNEEALKQILTRLKAEGWPLAARDLEPFPEKGEAGSTWGDDEFGCLDNDPFAPAWQEDDPFTENVLPAAEQRGESPGEYGDDLDEIIKHPFDEGKREGGLSREARKPFKPRYRRGW